MKLAQHAPGFQRVLLLSVSAGAGHVRAAQALRDYALRRDGVIAHHVDMIRLTGPVTRALYTSAYIRLVKWAPTLWGCLYRYTDRLAPHGWGAALWRALGRGSASALLADIAAFAPDAIICTHFLPAEILSGLVARGAVRCPVYVQVTDFDLHAMWVHPHMSGYFAANEEVGQRMRAYGLAPDMVHVTAIPVMPAFAAAYERAACATALGLDGSKTTLLLMGGGAGLGGLDVIAGRLLERDATLQLIVVAGANESLLCSLQRIAQQYPGRIAALGRTEQIERLMACADLLITKPGGLTTSESLAMGLPMIVLAPIPGQEERNADHLLEQGVALKAYDTLTLEYRITSLLGDPERLARMRTRAHALGRPHAGRDVLDIVLGRTESGQPC